MTNFTLDSAIADAKIMDAKQFSDKYDECIEWIDVNVGDPNDGVFNANLYAKDGDTTILFIDGEYQAN
jgi:hypothetical protein